MHAVHGYRTGLALSSRVPLDRGSAPDADDQHVDVLFGAGAQQVVGRGAAAGVAVDLVVDPLVPESLLGGLEGFRIWKQGRIRALARRGA